MLRIPNPYITGKPVSGRSFYGRQDIFRSVQDTFSSAHQNVVVLWGQRRMGKTSILHELPSRLSPEFHPIYFDLQDKAQQKLNQVLYDLDREIARSLNLDCPPETDFHQESDYFHDRFLPQVYQRLGTRRLLFLFDEFERLDIPVEDLADRDVAFRTFFSYLRRTLVSDRRLTFIFATGRRLDELDELFLSTFKMAKAIAVSFLEEAEARRLIVEPASGILEYDEEAVGRILSITACHPYLTQLICFELFSYMEAAGRTHVTASDVEAVVDRAIAAGGAGLAWLWDGLPMAERFVLAAVTYAAREGRVANQDEIGRILEEYRVPFSGPELTRAPDNLTTWGLLRRTADGYEFVVELLRRWILLEHSLEQAKRELELASPRAARLYELASEAHQVYELVRATRYYREALAANPNHLQAQLGLAQALFEQGRLEEAITEYERAYSFDRARAQDGLIEARHAWAETLEKEGRVDEADQEYETILRTAPQDRRVVEWVANRRLTRGRKYLAEDRYEEAVAEYEKAIVLDVPGVQEGLIAARRAWAEALEGKDRVGEADEQYEATLRIAPEDEGVREWVADSLIRRGDRYLEKGRYDEASQAYDQAEDIQPEKQQTLAQRRRQLELVPDYDRAMGAHEAGDWATAEREWAELYRKDRDYARKDGKTVAVLLAEAIEKREGISKRRQWHLILVSSGLAVAVAALILWLGWGSIVTSGQIGTGPLALVVRTPTPITPPTPALLPTSIPYSTYTPYPTYTIYPTPSPYPTYTPYPTPLALTETPIPTPPPIIIVVIATPAPTPTPRFPAPRLIGPEHGQEFFEGDASRIILQWEPVGPLAENEWYQVVLTFFKLGEIQYGGARLKETKWQVPAYFQGKADQPERAYYWNVMVVQVKKNPDGIETSVEQSPPSETRIFYWP